MKSVLKKVKTYMKAQDYTPVNSALQICTTYGTLKNERVLKTFSKWVNCCFPTSLRLFKEERLNKYV